ncbi:MAG: M50 family metallopeptidase [Elusimicrobiaceae bacterium]|nr:M50 family metallopeptidase [Elusimicrobiaceae bacterium]
MRLFKLLAALLLAPIVFFAIVEVIHILGVVLGHFQTALAFVAGAVVYALIHYTVYDFSRMYVFIHEMTHALVAFLCGSHIRKVSVRKESGYVKMDKVNTLIVLAPYFVPGYVLLIAFIYIAVDLFVDLTPYRQVFLFLVGFFISFHFIQTFKTLFEADQPDLELAGGKFFSIITISLANLVVLALVLKGLFPEQVDLTLAGKNLVRGTLNLGRILVNYILEHIANAL